MQYNKTNIPDRYVRRIWNKVQIPSDLNDCWNWTGACDRDGYGRINVNTKSYRSHRLIYEMYNGYFNQNLEVCHKCDNPRCVNPNHLFLGTLQDNMDDKVSKNRQVQGSRVNTAKLSENDVYDILSGIQSGKYKNQTVIRKKFGFTATGISDMMCGRTWKKLTERICTELNTTLNNLRIKSTKDTSVYNSRGKLSDNDVRTIRLLLSQGQSGNSIAKQFGITAAGIYRIRDGKAYKHVI